jgi:ABC-type dipeptide/oligopeptide/nickel transport system permease component
VPGIGRYFITSIATRDYPVMLGTTLLLAFAVALVNLVVDLLYAVVDPRIRYDRGARR